jgi:HK97 family phage major capsid protein
VTQIKVTSEAPTYRKDGQVSWFRDIILQNEDPSALRRLERNDAEVRDVKGRSGGGGAGFIPPAWLAEDYAPIGRAPRPIADRMVPRDMPPAGIDSVKVPQLTGGAAVAVQAQELDGVQETDITSAPITNHSVVTISGMQDVSKQAFLRSDPGLDSVLYADLRAAYDSQLESQIISGTGSNGQHLGVRNVSSITMVTYTSGTPDQQSAFSAIAKAVSQVCTLRFVDNVLIAMHPRRAAWLAASSGTASLSDNPALAELGFNVEFVTDPSIPTSLGAGTNQDQVLVLHMPSFRLAEDVFSLTCEDVLSGTGTIRFILYSYSLAETSRYPKAIALVDGTGLTSVVGF